MLGREATLKVYGDLNTFIEFALQNEVVYICYDVICSALLDPPSWISLFSYQKVKLLQSQPKILVRLSIIRWSELERYRIISKQQIFVPTYMEFTVALASKIMETYWSRYRNFRERWMNSYWKFQHVRLNLFLKTSKQLLVGWYPRLPFPSPCIQCTRVNITVHRLIIIIKSDNKI